MNFGNQYLYLLRKQLKRYVYYGLDCSIYLFGGLKSDKMGSVPRLRKCLLEVGVHLRSVRNDRGWSPQPWGQLKSSMGAMLNLCSALANLEHSVQRMIRGKDFVCRHDFLQVRAKLL